MTRSYRLGIQIVVGAILDRRGRVILGGASLASRRLGPPGKAFRPERSRWETFASSIARIESSHRTIFERARLDRLVHLHSLSVVVPPHHERDERPHSPARDSNVLFASISVDPEFDTPAVLSEYAQKFGAPPRSLVFPDGRQARNSQPDPGSLQARRAGGVSRRESGWARRRSPTATASPWWKMARWSGFSNRATARPSMPWSVRHRRRALPGWIKNLPALNASLNGLSAILLLLGWVLIRQRMLRRIGFARSVDSREIA